MKKKGEKNKTKKVINGSRYDTNTAKCLARWEVSQDYSDFNWYDESLYRTKAGKWFLHGRGGAATVYATRKEDGCTAPGEQIIPLSEDAARWWAEQHLSKAFIDQLFVQSSDLTQVAAYLPADLLAKLDSEKSKSGRSRSDIIIDALRKYL